MTRTITEFSQVGRTDAPDPNQPRVSVTHLADFSNPDDIEIDFTVVNQIGVFGIPRTIFVDNGYNPNPMFVEVGISQQKLTLAPYSVGYYTITANDKSRIRFFSDGGAPQKITISAFNYIVPANVWYSYNPGNSPIGDAVAGTIADGNPVASSTGPNPIYIGGIDRGTGLFHGISVNPTGVVDVNINNGLTIDTSTPLNVTTVTPVTIDSNTPVNVAEANVNGAYSNISIASLSGSSEPLVAANPDRRVLYISNTGANPIAVNLTGGTAALNTAGSITIAAGGELNLSDYAPTNAITVIGTAAQPVTAYEAN